MISNDIKSVSIGGVYDKAGVLSIKKASVEALIALMSTQKG